MAGTYAVYNNQDTIPTSVDVPFWTLGVGAASFVVGILVAGKTVTKVLGEEITDFDAMKAFSA